METVKKVVRKATAKHVYFPNVFFKLIVPSVVKPTTKVHFHVPLEITKPEIKNYLTAYYGLKIKDVNTMIYRGKTRRGKLGSLIKTADWKKAIVTLYEPVSVNIEMPPEMKQRMDEEAKKGEEETKQIGM